MKSASRVKSLCGEIHLTMGQIAYAMKSACGGRGFRFGRRERIYPFRIGVWRAINNRPYRCGGVGAVINRPKVEAVRFYVTRRK